MTHTTEELQREMAHVLEGRVEDPQGVAAGIFDAFARVREPELKADVSHNTELITLGSTDFSGVSIKPGNIRLNWKTLFEKTPELVLTGAGVTQVWLIPFAALYVWNLVRSLSSIHITQDHGTVMYALWHDVRHTRHFDEAQAHAITNDFRAQHGLTALDATGFSALVTDLARLGCVELTNGRLWLREWTQRAH